MPKPTYDFGNFGVQPYQPMPSTQLPSSAAGIGGAYNPTISAPAGNTGWYGQANNFLNSPTGKFAVGVAGSYMQGKGQEAQLKQQLEFNQQRLQTDARLNVAQQLQNRAMAGADRPLGESQNFTQRQLLNAALANQLFSGKAGIRSGNPAVASRQGFQPTVNPVLAAQLGDVPTIQNRTAASIAQREADLLSVNPNLAQTDLAGLGLPGVANDPRVAGMQRGQQLWDTQDGLFAEQLNAQKKADLVKQTGKAIDPKTGLPKGYIIDPKTGEMAKRPFWQTKKGKAIRIGALAAATVATGGASSPALAAAIAAGSGAFQGYASGGGWKGALTGAALGGATAGLGGGVGGAAGKAAAGAAGKQAAIQIGKQAMLNAAKNPNLYMQSYGIARG